METILAARGITHTHPGRGSPILRDVSLELREGESTAIMGVSGSGKTTLLRILSGLLRPDAGSVEYRGKPLTRPRRDVALLFQNYSDVVFPWMTVVDNILLGRPRHERSKHLFAAQQLVEKLGLVDNKANSLGDAMASTLSGGQRQRVAIGRALIQDASIVLLDEPFSALDEISRHSLTRLLKDLGEVAPQSTRRPTTFVIVSHDLEDALITTKRRLCLLSSGAKDQLREFHDVLNNTGDGTDMTFEIIALKRKVDQIVEILREGKATGITS